MKEKLKKITKLITNKHFIAIIMASFTYCAICSTETIKIYDISSWLVYFALLILYLKTNIFNSKLKKEAIIFSVLFSFIIVFGGIVYRLQDNAELSVFRELLKLNSLFKFIGIFNIIYIILINLFPKLYDFKLKSKKSKINKSWLVFIICLIIILIAWIPYFLTFYPGTLTPDSLGELETIVNHFSNVSDHHPVIHILFISIPYNIGLKLFGSMTAGVAFATIFQMIILASIFSSFITFLHNRKVNDFILLIIMLYYAVVPMHGYYSVVMWKDVIFSGSLLLLTMETIKIIEKEKTGELKFKNIISFILVSLLCVFFRNNAIYMYIVLAIVTLIFFRKYFKIFIAGFLIVFGVYFIIKGPVFNYFNVSKSASAEYIGMPLQQVGRMAFKHVEFTKEEKELINELIPVNIMASNYNPRVSDGIKFNKNYNGRVFDENKGKYFKLWLKLVKKHPSIALEAYSISTLGYWYPGVEYWSVANNIWDNEYSLKTDSKAPLIVSNYIKNIESRYVPIVNIEWSIGFCFWIILIFGMLSVKKNGINGLYPFVPIFGIWLTMMIASPVYAEFRYVYGAYTSLPLLMICPFLKLKR